MQNLDFLPLTARDEDILHALDRCPLTASQILKLSETFAYPFTNERKVRARLQVLSRVWVQRRHYATTNRGTLNYYTLSPNGHRLLHDDALPPVKRTFAVAVARQAHTRCLAEFTVHTLVSAHRADIAVTDFQRENALRLTAGENQHYPDSAFTLRTPADEEYDFYVEVDNHTERICSTKDVESWERMIRFYEALQDQSRRRFRVLAITRHGGDRLKHILDAAASLARFPNRRLLYGIALSHYLVQPEPLTTACFLDHGRQSVSLIPQRYSRPLGPGRDAIAAPVVPDPGQLRYSERPAAAALPSA